jgi:Mitochondrial K+-H+ exchange-related
MQVFLVPVGAQRYRLYVEIPDEVDKDVTRDAPKGRVGGLMQRFREMLAEAEADRRRAESGEEPQGSGLWRGIMRKIAEAIAEQRLLWHLRHQTVVQLCHPTDLDATRALEEVRSDFTRETAKHLRWLVIDSVLVAITGPLFFFVPGPNVVSWYFTFRAVGHFLSWRGAKKGRTLIEWQPEACPPLTDVRLAIELPAPDRRHRLEQIAEALGLKHFAGFVERVSNS